MARTVTILCFLALLAAPFLFRPGTPPPPPDALELIIVTPHNEQIRQEFARAFDSWHERTFGERVQVIYNVPGGTSEIRKMLEAQYRAAIEDGREPGGDADLVFGGGSYEHDRLKRGVSVTVDGETRREPISAPVDFTTTWLDDVYGENIVGDARLYDPDRHWFGNALSRFGIVYNRDVLRRLELDDPGAWSDLCDPALRGWVALVNPGQSGSITTAFEAILQRLGWREGWQTLRRAGANSRYFAGSSLKPPTDVSQGQAAMGVCIDFYGRYQAQAIVVAGDPDRVGYVDPPDASTIDPDPISMLRGAPHPVLARRFVEFLLTDEGQALWQFRADDPAADGLGPERYELRRLPVLRSFYEDHFDRLIDPVNPFEIASPLENPSRDVRSFIAILFASMVMDNHEALAEAWTHVVEHPAYPPGGGLVTAADVTDPELRAMLERFDAMPTVAGPGGVRLSLDGTAALKAIREGWLNGGWADEGLWPPEAVPGDVLRRQSAAFFRMHYEAIVDGEPASRSAQVPAPPAGSRTGASLVTDT